MKQLAIIISDYSDFLIFQPPVSFNSLPKSEQIAYNWLTNNLHGIHWGSGDYIFLNLHQIIQSFVLRNPNAIFYAKGDFLLFRKINNKFHNHTFSFPDSQRERERKKIEILNV